MCIRLAAVQLRNKKKRGEVEGHEVTCLDQFCSNSDHGI